MNQRPKVARDKQRLVLLHLSRSSWARKWWMGYTEEETKERRSPRRQRLTCSVEVYYTPQPNASGQYISLGWEGNLE
jgi:hypothetical protein